MANSFLTAVIGIEVLFGRPPDSVQQGDFQRIIGTAARQFGSPVAAGVLNTGIQLHLVATPEHPVAPTLRRLSAAMDELLGLHPTALVRLLAHHGVVFINEADGRKSYVGSAIRSMQSFVRRLGDLDGLYGTREFAAHVATWAQSPLRLADVPGVEGMDGLVEIRFDAGFVLPVIKQNAVASGDAALLHYIKRRLADELGPLAAALVDAAQRTSPSASDLVKEMAAEIDNPAARQRFEADLAAYLKKGS
ncbi:hypothetical protein [Viridibacterium curvum]|uniref:DUF8082 domain-containing protein n=1 Tax=Viridibacterium curvum TaxID=1101404 RepID=A0ABP9QFF2_9RHOO